MKTILTATVRKTLSTWEGLSLLYFGTVSRPRATTFRERHQAQVSHPGGRRNTFPARERGHQSAEGTERWRA